MDSPTEKTPLTRTEAEQQAATDFVPLSGWQLKFSKLFLLKQRYVLGVMGMLALCNAYAMRVSFDAAFTRMVKPVGETASQMLLRRRAGRSNMVEPYDWSANLQKLIQGAFYIGYVIALLPSGMLAEHHGGKWVLGVGLLCTSLCTLLTPLCARFGGAFALIAFRFIEGMGEGPTMPAMMMMLTRWIPELERGRIGALVFGGAQLGHVVGTAISGRVLERYSWEPVFYIFGGLGLLWFLLWSLLCYSTPSTHPYISDSERAYLHQKLTAFPPKPLKKEEKTTPKKKSPIPWRAILMSRPVWALTVALIGHNWGYYTAMTNMPQYMKNSLGYDINASGMFSTLPYLSMWVAAFLFGCLCDYCCVKGYHSVHTARKLYTTISNIGPGLCLIGASYLGACALPAVAWLVSASTLMAAYYPGMQVNAMDIAPHHAGTTAGLVFGISGASGVVAPFVTNLMTHHHTQSQYRHVFWSCFGVLMFSNVVYLIWSQASPQAWDDVDKYGNPSSWKYGPLPDEKDAKVNEENEDDKKNPLDNRQYDWYDHEY